MMSRRNRFQGEPLPARHGAPLKCPSFGSFCMRRERGKAAHPSPGPGRFFVPSTPPGSTRFRARPRQPSICRQRFRLLSSMGQCNVGSLRPVPTAARRVSWPARLPPSAPPRPPASVRNARRGRRAPATPPRNGGNARAHGRALPFPLRPSPGRLGRGRTRGSWTSARDPGPAYSGWSSAGASSDASGASEASPPPVASSADFRLVAAIFPRRSSSSS